ncbi:Twin-arginine translocation protein TatB [gamma proteobacterium IMCC2047]|nr:Twin-arginine translocation protein TatB [gamma proteobacterium IMCC2047]
MFDIGFTEIMIIGLVALIVIGPSRLPEAMRSCAMWIGRAKRMMGNVRRDLENEIGIDEIRQDLRNEKIMEGLKADAIADEKERLAKEAREKANPPHGNSYLDSAHQNGSPNTDAEPTAEPDQPQPKENNH